MENNLIYILNKKEKIINILNNTDGPNKCPFFDDLLSQSLSTGADTYKFSTIFNDKNSATILVGNKVAFMYKGDFLLFQIISVDEIHNENMEIEVYCESAGLSLINNVCRKTSLISSDIRKFLETVLQDTEWNIGLVDMAITNSIDVEIPTASVYSILQNNLSRYKAEIRFRCELNNGRISKKYVDVFKERGRFTGKRFEFGKNIEGLTRSVDSSELYTALIGEGKNGIDFKDIELPDVPNKPVGADFVYDQESFNLYNHNGYHLMGVYKFETESPEELLRETYKKLQECKNPKITYDVNVSLLDYDVSVGDTVNIIDRFFNPPLFLKARVNKLEESLTDKNIKKCVLSNFIEVRSNINSSLLDQIKDFVNNTVTDRFPIGTGDIQDGAVTGDKIYESSITTDHLIAGSVTADKIQANSIRADHISANQIKANHIEAQSIDATKIQADSIQSEHIVANAIKSKHLDADSITADKIQADSIQSQHIQANQIQSGHIQSNSIDADKIQANSIDSNHIKANAIKTEHLDTGSITTDKLQANSITADKIQAGSITAGSGIIADGAIGSAQINSVEVGKLEAGDISTSKHRVVSANGEVEIVGNQILINREGQNRVTLGEYVKDEDGTTEYGLLVRGKDGKTVMIDDSGVHNAGITDGSIDNNKVSDNANISGNKLDINSVIREVNDNGTESIKGTKVVVGDRSLEVELSEQKNTITEHGKEISTQKSEIQAMDDKISLKVDNQTFTEATQTITQSIGTAKNEAINIASQDATNKANQAQQNAINSASQDASQKTEQALQEAKAYTNVEISTVDKKLSKATSEIKVLQDEISTKVSQTDIDKSIANIKFGGRNLVLDSMVNESSSKYDFANRKVADIKPNTTYTLSANGSIKSNSNGLKLIVYIYPKDWSWQYSILFQLEKAETKSVTFTTPQNIGEGVIVRACCSPNTPNVEPNLATVNWYKLEEGNKPSDWTPAPEDFNQAIVDNISVVNEKISSVESKLTQDLDGVKVNVGSLENKTTQIESNVNVVKSELTGKIEDVLQDSKEYSDNAKNQAIDSSKEYVNVQINATNSKVSEVASGLEVLKDKVETKVSQSDIDKSLVEVNDSIKVTQENINEVSSKVTQLKDSVNTEISSLKSKTQTIESDLGNKATKVEVQELNTQIAQQNVSLEGITNRVGQTESKTTQLEVNIGNVNKDLSGKITDNLNQSKEYTDEEVNKSKDEAINSSNDYTNSQIGITTEKINTVESSLNILKDKVETKVSQSDIDNSLVEVKDTIKVTNSKIENVSSTVTQLKDSVETEINSLKSKTQTIEINLDGKATKQEVSELSTQVAEQKVSLDGITNRVGQTESKTTQLETNITVVRNDLSSKIDENLEDSKSYADQVSTSKSQEAKSQAISSASQDATNKANSAKDEAINSSKEYTNVQISATNSKISGVESSVDILKEKIESKVSQSDIDKSISNIQIGDRNYLVNSLLNLTTSSYLIKLVYFGNEKPKEGEEFTVSIKGNLGEGKEAFGVYNSGGMISLARLDKKDSDGIYRKTFKWRIADSANTHLEIYTLNNSVTVDSTIEWIKLEKGNKVSSSWTPAPEDVDSKIQDSIKVTDEKINKVSSTVTQLKDSVTTEISSLKSKTQTIESNLDGKASKSEVQELNTQVAQQKVSLDGITNRVGETETKTSQLEGSLSEVNRDLTGKINEGVQSAKEFATGQANQAKDEAINDSNSYTNTQINATNSKVSSVESSLDILKDKVETKVSQTYVDESLVEVNDSIKATQREISSVSSGVTQLRDSVNTQISSLNSKTQSLETNLEGKATKQEVSEVNNRVTSIDANLQGITQRVSNTESKTQSLETTLDGKATKTEVQNVKEQVASVEIGLSGITNRVSNTESNINSVNDKIQNTVTKSEFTEFKQNTDSFKFTVEQRSSMNNLVPNSSFEGYGRAWTCNGEFWSGPYVGYDFKGRFCGAIKNSSRYNNEKYLMSEKCFRVKKNTTYTLNFKFALEQNVDSMDAFVILSDSESTNYGRAIHMYNASGGSQTNNWQEECISRTFNTGNYEWVWLRFDNNGMKQGVNVNEWCWLYISEVGVYEGDVGQVKWIPSGGESYSSSFLLDRNGLKVNFDDGSYAYMGRDGFEWYNSGTGHSYHALAYVTSFDIPAGNPGRAYVKLPVEFTKRKNSLKWTVATRGYYYSTTGSFFPYHVHCSGFAPAYEENGQLVCPVEGVCKIQNSNNSNDVQFRSLTAMLIAVA